jgi:hypothetical protein
MAQTPRGSSSRRKKASETPSHGGERETYKGHEIVVVRDDPGRRIVIDGESFGYDRAGDEFYLDIYAYDRDRSLMAVAKRYIDFREEAAARQAEHGAQ